MTCAKIVFLLKTFKKRYTSIQNFEKKVIFVKKMQKILLYLVATLLFFSCNKLDYNNKVQKDEEDCSNFSCTTEEPHSAILKIRFTRNVQNTTPLIIVSTGYWETHVDIIKVVTDTIPQYMNYIEVSVPVDRYYTVYTSYLKNNDTIIAIDGKFVYKNKYSECETECWELKNTEFSIRLK